MSSSLITAFSELVLSSSYANSQTWVGNLVLKKREGGVAAIVARSYYKVCNCSNGAIVSMGVNEDTFEKREGMWKIVRRRMQSSSSSSGGKPPPPDDRALRGRLPKNAYCSAAIQ